MFSRKAYVSMFRLELETVMSSNQTQQIGSAYKPPGELGRSRRFALAPWTLFRSVFGSMYWWWGFSLCAVAISAYAGRHAMNPDGLSYLDIASSTLSGGPSGIVSGYWSPGYPALLSLALLLVRPTAEHVFALLHFVNLLIFIVAIGTFSFFLRSFFTMLEQYGALIENWRSYFTPVAFSTFLFFSLRFIGTDFVTPDLAVAAVVFLAAGLGCCLSLPIPKRRHYIALGFVLGLGYYVKAPMLPLGIVFLALLSLDLQRPRCMPRQTLLVSYLTSFLVALSVTVPWITALSVREGKLSFGDSGRLNYAWYVNGNLWAEDLEHPKPYETPNYPAPKLMPIPLTLQFASPIGGTYPLWYDPPFWYRGLKARFDLRQQVGALKETWQTFKAMFIAQAVFIVGAVVLLVTSALRRTAVALPPGIWWLLAWPVAASLMYALVHVEPRFLGAFLILWWVASFGSLLLRAGRMVALPFCITLVCILAIPITADLRAKSADIVRDLHHPTSPDYQIIALRLRDLGLRSGDRVAIVGYAYNCYYARYDHLRVIAQVPNETEFSNLEPAQFRALVERLGSIGVNALIVPTGSKVPADPDWGEIKISESKRAWVLLIPKEGRR